LNQSSLSYPFLRPEFLQALEQSGSACEATGWMPIHLSLKQTQQDAPALMPLYLKDHSMGEYVFDWAWANAYHQNGLDYYPKLVTSIPFTPSTGPRVATKKALSKEDSGHLIDEVLAVADETGASSWHFLFPNAEQLALFNDPRLLQRSGVQYHWHNRGYNDFDDFLGSMNSRKRKMVRKERGDIIKQGLRVSIEVGADISSDIWRHVYQLD